MSQWMWKFGDFEIYHSMLLHNRRQQYSYPEPPVWKIYAPDTVVKFRKRLHSNGGTFHVRACGDCSVRIHNFDTGALSLGSGETTFELPVADIEITVHVSNIKTFPCAIVWGDVESDGTWEVCDLTPEYAPVGTSAMFTSPDTTPEIFPFCYEAVQPVSREEVNGGVLFDYGKELFAAIDIAGLGAEPVLVCLGESREEALDRQWSVIHSTLTPQDGRVQMPASALRYIWISDAGAQPDIRYQYADLKYRADFAGDDALLERIWQLAAYTFHLNSREFLLDGIKRDRWVWSGDAYQSLFVCHYLFMDAELEKRTLIALGGKQPVGQHLNTIMDYTFLWVLGLYEYYESYGDRHFIEQIYPQARAIMDFALSRRDADGFVRAKDGDWIFIDWADMDKTGALAGEQILLAAAMEKFACINDILGKDSAALRADAAKLRARITEKFYDAERGVFIDSYESGLKNVTRHSNILAYLYMDCDEATKAGIYKNALLNPEVAPITTPYFKFFENRVYCEAGEFKRCLDNMDSYYGAMLETGATSLYEQFDPRNKGVEHYAMYGRPYEKSLCHAWSASPVYFVGRYLLGVRNTGIAYDTFEVKPDCINMKNYKGTVPLPEGEVCVEKCGNRIAVTASAAGGTLIVGTQRIALEPGKEVCIDL